METLLELEGFQDLTKQILLTYFRNTRKNEALEARLAATTAHVAETTAVPVSDHVAADHVASDHLAADHVAADDVTDHVTVYVTMPEADPAAFAGTVHVMVPVTVSIAVPVVEHLVCSTDMSEIITYDPDGLHEDTIRPTTTVIYNDPPENIRQLLLECICDDDCECPAP